MSELPQLRDAIEAATQTLRTLSSLEPQMAQAADVIDQCLRAGNKLLVCGNGGSAADASHFATELVVRFAKERRALPTICLTSDSGILTAAGNDYGFDEIFARQVAAFGVPGDVLICLTTSGKSRNVIRALEEAKARKLRTIAFLGAMVAQPLAWLILIFWSEAIPQRELKKPTSFCFTCCARSLKRGSFFDFTRNFLATVRARALTAATPLRSGFHVQIC